MRRAAPVLAVLHGPSAAGKTRWLEALSPWLRPIELDDVGYCPCEACGGIVAGPCRWDGWTIRVRGILARRRAARRHPGLHSALPVPEDRNTRLCQDYLLARLPPRGQARVAGWAASKGYLNVHDRELFARLHDALGIEVRHVLLLPPRDVHERQIEARGLGGRREEVLASRDFYDAADYDLVLEGGEDPEGVVPRLRPST